MENGVSGIHGSRVTSHVETAHAFGSGLFLIPNLQTAANSVRMYL